MIITNDFVFIHFPKNAGSFVTKCLKELYDKSTDKNRKAILTDNIHYLLDKEKTNYSFHYVSKSFEYSGKRIRSQHQGCDEIPLQHRDKPIISIIRNPFDRYVSLYKYGHWKKNSIIEPEVLRKDFPNFPDLTFEEYMHFSFDYSLPILKESIKTNLDIGVYTLYYLKLFLKDYVNAIASASDTNQIVKDDFYEVEFLLAENINRELYGFLEKTGWPKERIQFILEQQKVNTSRSSSSYREYYNQNLIDLVMEKDALLFRLFPEFTF